jgi:hypothetical protein
MKRLLIAIWIITAIAAAQLRITVYDQAHLPEEVGDPAFDDLRKVFRQAGIEPQIVSGDLHAQEALLITYPAPAPKGHEQEAACRARRDIALEILAITPPGFKGTIAGMAVPLASAGLNARVFVDRVRDVAFRENRPVHVILTYVIAHEIGHVLLRSNRHARQGLMSSVWAEHEYRLLAAGLMSFSRAQSDEMRANLIGAVCRDGQAAENSSSSQPSAIEAPHLTSPSAKPKD